MASAIPEAHMGWRGPFRATVEVVNADCQRYDGWRGPLHATVEVVYGLLAYSSTFLLPGLAFQLRLVALLLTCFILPVS